MLSGTEGTAQTQVSVTRNRRRMRILLALLGVGVALVAAHSIGFQVLMAAEGERHSWVTAVYWTLSTMSTLGYGDITLTSDAGRLFTIWVLTSGMLWLALLVPLALIQFVVTPWLQQLAAARAPRRLPPEIRDHILVVGFDSVVQALVARAKRARIPAVLVVSEAEQARGLLDQGYQVLIGALDDPRTYRNARVEHAALVVSTLPDTANTNVVFTVQSIAPHVPIAVTAAKRASIDVLTLAGAERVLHLGQNLGEAIADRVLGTRGTAHVIGSFGATAVAEAAIRGTALAGLTVAQVRDRIGPGVRLLAVMDRGRLQELPPSLVLPEAGVLILAGSPSALAQYDAAFSHPAPARDADRAQQATGAAAGTEDAAGDAADAQDRADTAAAGAAQDAANIPVAADPQADDDADAPVVILGGGRVGRATAAALATSGTPTTIVEQDPTRTPGPGRMLYGDAAEAQVLKEAGLEDATAVVVTTHDDDLNVYLTLYCRRLRPDVQIVARATAERNVATLYRAGADSVLSYATVGATMLWNEAGLGQRLVIAEGNELFTVPLPAAAGALAAGAAPVHRRTGVHLVATLDAAGHLLADGRPADAEGAQLLVLGDRHAEQTFRQTYQRGPLRRRVAGRLSPGGRGRTG
ncbi:MAG TPA: NAD-binding protein [Beutenbergiaceae bacterium]|nr:NAD-binding protein [Beutenbergiaceae bacterium]